MPNFVLFFKNTILVELLWGWISVFTGVGELSSDLIGELHFEFNKDIPTFIFSDSTLPNKKYSEISEQNNQFENKNYDKPYFSSLY